VRSTCTAIALLVAWIMCQKVSQGEDANAEARV